MVGLQFHPSRVSFEWSPASETVDHGGDAVRAMQYVAGWFVGQAKLCTNRWSSDAQRNKALIYHWSPAYTVGLEPVFEQCYMFAASNGTSLLAR